MSTQLLTEAQGQNLADHIATQVAAIRDQAEEALRLANLILATTTAGQVGSFNLGAPQNIQVSPVGNPTGALDGVHPLYSLSSLSVSGLSTSNDHREFMVNLGMVCTHGNAIGGVGNLASADHALLYMGMVAKAGAGDVWCGNPLLNLDATLASNARIINAQNFEFDYNNGYRHYGDGDPDMVFPIAANIGLTGFGLFRATCALYISGSGQVQGAGADYQNAIWNVGVMGFGNTIAQGGAFIRDYNNFHDASIDIRGLPTYGIKQRQGGVKNFFAGSMEVHGQAVFSGTLGAEAAVAGGAVVLSLANTYAGASISGVHQQFVLRDTTNTPKQAALLQVNGNDANHLNTHVTLGLRRGDVLLDAMTWAADGSFVPAQLVADPASPAEGAIWYRADLHALRQRQNGATKTLAVN